MTTDRRSVTLWLPPADFGVFVAYVVMLCTFVPFHEPWADEAQAWLLSRDLSVYSLLFRNLRYEGHPALWYLLLWIPTHLHVSYALFNWFSAAIASAGIYVLLRFSPFPFYLRALLPFTFFLGYQYSVVARSYVLFPLLGFLVAHVYRVQKPRPVLMAVLLGLLANVSVHGTIVALAFAALYVLKLRQDRTASETATPTPQTLRLAAAIFTGSILFVAVCLWPAADSLPRLSPTLNRVISRLSVPTPAAYTPHIPVPATATPSAVVATAPPKAPTFGARGSRLANIPVVLGFAFAASWVLAVLYDGLLLVYLFRQRQLKMALPAALLALFLIFVYSAPWHLGLLWVTGIIVLWTVWDSSIAPGTLDLQNIVAVFLALLCVLQLPWTFNAFRFDARNATAPDKAAAAYLHTLPVGTRIAGFDMSGGVQPYFRQNIFFNQRQTFTYFGQDPFVLSPQQVIAERPDVVVTDSYTASAILAGNYRETHRFCGSLYLPSHPLDPSCLYIFEPPQ